MTTKTIKGTLTQATRIVPAFQLGPHLNGFRAMLAAEVAVAVGESSLIGVASAATLSTWVNVDVVIVLVDLI